MTPRPARSARIIAWAKGLVGVPPNRGVDHTGKPVDLLTRLSVFEHHDPALVERFDRLASETGGESGGPLRWGLSLLSRGLVTSVAVAFTGQLFSRNWTVHQIAIALGVSFGVVIVASIPQWFVGRTIIANAETVVRLWLAQGVCPSCGYPLDKVEPNPPIEPDDPPMVTCPECASTWRWPPPRRR